MVGCATGECPFALCFRINNGMKSYAKTNFQTLLGGTSGTAQSLV